MSGAVGARLWPAKLLQLRHDCLHGVGQPLKARLNDGAEEEPEHEDYPTAEEAPRRKVKF